MKRYSVTYSQDVRTKSTEGRENLQSYSFISAEGPNGDLIRKISIDFAITIDKCRITH